jgi:DNA gyrase/topoisomerase IV subunit A
MKASIKTKDGNSTLKLEIDFNQLLNDNFEEVCKAIAIRGKVLREIVTVFEANNEIIESVFQILKSSRGEEEATLNLCKALNVSTDAAQYLLNMPIEEMSSLGWEVLKEKLNNYTKLIESL